MSKSNEPHAIKGYALHIKREGRRTLRLFIPSLAAALESARHRAAMLRGAGTVSISPVLYVSR